MESMILAEIGSPIRRTWISPEANAIDLRLNQNLLEERREMSALKEATYKKKLEKYYNDKVGRKHFKAGDVVLRSNEARNQIPKGKLAPRWEGPYKIVSITK